MTYAPDFTTDLEVLYGLDTFTLKVQGEADIALSECVVTEPINTHEPEAVDGQVPRMDQMIVWPVYKSPTKPPLGSCLVDEDDNYWTILSIVRKQHVETWEAHCLNLTIIPSVTNTATLLRAVYGKGKANEARAIWQGLISGETPATVQDMVAARFQPVMELAMIRYGAEWAKQTYRMLVQSPLPIEMAGGEYRVVDGADNRYRIMELFNEQRLDKLPCALVVRITEGREFYHAGSPAQLAAPQFPVP